MLDSHQIQSLYLRFFGQRGHNVIDPGSIVARDDPGLLFTCAGMHPLVPYLRGQPHPLGRRLVGCQPCLRTGDIDEVGDATHLTCFHMLGNWSLGDYGRTDSIRWSHEFLTSPEQLSIDPTRLSVTVFGGGFGLPRDDESAELWNEVGVPSDRISFLGTEHNWWSTGPEGPCGPDTEIFFDRTGQPCSRGERCRPGVCECGRHVEIWNNVFMTHERGPGGLTRLSQPNVDTGMGLERIASVLGGHQDVYRDGRLQSILRRVQAVSSGGSLRSQRIVADHLRAASTVLAELPATDPSNQGAGSVLRRLIRRAVVHRRRLGITPDDWTGIVSVCGRESDRPGSRPSEVVRQILLGECERFDRVCRRGEITLTRELDRLEREGLHTLEAEVAFRLHETHGFPIELTAELAAERGVALDDHEVQLHFSNHRRRSRSR